jgi:hypothetical protein
LANPAAQPDAIRDRNANAYADATIAAASRGIARRDR